MSSRLLRLALSLCITTIIMMIIVFAASNDNPYRLLVMFGGVMPEGLIQGVTLFLFIWGLFEIGYISHRMTIESDAFRLGLLPEKENWVISPDDLNAIKLKVTEYEKKKKYWLTDLIRKACTKYRLSKSSSEVLGLVEAQVKTYQLDFESQESIIRYIAWAIPSVGFIGTVIGIAGALGIANQATSPAGIKAVTDMLAVAFDTTLIALIYSLILMYFIHSLQEKENKFFAGMSNYLVENLINRFYKQ